jgi:hypothetical protein
LRNDSFDDRRLIRAEGLLCHMLFILRRFLRRPDSSSGDSQESSPYAKPDCALSGKPFRPKVRDFHAQKPGIPSKALILRSLRDASFSRGMRYFPARQFLPGGGPRLRYRPMHDEQSGKFCRGHGARCVVAPPRVGG